MGKGDGDGLFFARSKVDFLKCNQAFSNRHNRRNHIMQVELDCFGTFAFSGVFHIECYGIVVFAEVQIAEFEGSITDAFTECKERCCRKVAILAAMPTR